MLRFGHFASSDDLSSHPNARVVIVNQIESNVIIIGIPYFTPEDNSQKTNRFFSKVQKVQKSSTVTQFALVYNPNHAFITQIKYFRLADSPN